MTAPRYAYDTAILADLAAHLLAQRVSGYPAHVAAGRLTQAQADDGTRQMHAIAVLWRAYADRHPDPQRSLVDTAPREIKTTLHAAAVRAGEIAKADRANTDKANYAAAVHALAWWAEVWWP